LQGAIQNLCQVDAFCEKPNAATAQKYVQEGMLWNAGMFFVRAKVLLDEIRKYMPQTAAGLDAIAGHLHTPHDVSEEVYPSLPSFSIDYGVMEKSQKVMTLPGNFGWSDVGSWDALCELHEADTQNNITLGNAVLHEATGNLVISDDGSLVAMAGVQNMIVIKHGNAVLVLPKDRSQDVRMLVQAMRDGNLESFL